MSRRGVGEGRQRRGLNYFRHTNGDAYSYRSGEGEGLLGDLGSELSLGLFRERAGERKSAKTTHGTE